MDRFVLSYESGEQELFQFDGITDQLYFVEAEE